MIALNKTALALLRSALRTGVGECVSGIHRPRTSGRKGPGKWSRRAGGRDARALALLEDLGLVTVTRTHEHGFDFRGTSAVFRPTLVAYTVIALATEATP